MKKIITMLLVICMTVGIMAAPASAATINLNWIDWNSIYNWFPQPPAAEPNEPVESEEPEVPAESEDLEETEVPEETEPVAETYTIRYDANGGYWWYQYSSPAISSSKSYKVTAGETHTVLTTVPIRTCYTFGGWKDEDGNVYQAGDVITPTKSMTMKAIWK